MIVIAGRNKLSLARHCSDITPPKNSCEPMSSCKTCGLSAVGETDGLVDGVVAVGCEFDCRGEGVACARACPETSSSSLLLHHRSHDAVGYTLKN